MVTWADLQEKADAHKKGKKSWKQWDRGETVLHKGVWKFISLTIIPLGHFAWHNPNQGRRSWLNGKELKEMGFQTGFPDLGIMPNRVKFPILVPGFMEFKYGYGKLTEKQTEIKNLLTSMGYHYAEIRSIDEAKEALVDWKYL